MNKLIIKNDSKYISSFEFKHMFVELDVFIETESVTANITILNKDFIEELNRLDLSLKKRFGDNVSYLYSSNLTEDENIFISISILNFFDSISKIMFNNYKIENKSTINIYLSNLNLNDFEEIQIKLTELLNQFKITKKVHFKEQDITNIDDGTKKRTSQKGTVILGKPIEYNANNTKAKDLEIGKDGVIEGRVFNLDIRKTKITIISFNLDCKIDSFKIKCFVNKDVKLKNDDIVKVKGKKQFDSFINDTFFLASDITKIEIAKSIKTEEPKDMEKRVEFNVHTKMSEMGSIIDIDNLINKAKECGYTKLAITDSNVVYGFPDAYKKAKMNNMNIIFGMEGSLVNDSYIAKDIDLSSYVVFDIETTGFNPYSEKIIEIGAIKVVNGQVIDKFDSLINPETAISKFTEELTGINDEMVKNAPKIDVVLANFLKFIENNTLIAHNAEFDIGFIYQNTKRLNLNFNNRYIDNLDIARTILKDNKKHGLKDLAKHYNLTFQHHRALNDADITYKIFIKLLENNLNIDISTLKRDVTNSYPYNVLIYAKNVSGLKDLYEIVSNAHLNFFKRFPKIPKSYLASKREHLIIGASFNYGELVESYSKGKNLDQIKENAKFYDFIEISPVETSSMLENFSQQELEGMILELINIGDELNIPIIATSNARYINEEDFEFIKPLNHFVNSSVVNRKQYFRNTTEMLEAFSFLDRAKEFVIENTIKLSEQIENIRPLPEGFYPPVIENADEEIKNITYTNATKIFGDNLHPIISERISHEIKSITENNFSVLYLIAHKLVKKSLEDSYLVGSRGSVGSSLVAWLMNITEVNPLSPYYLCKVCKKIEFVQDNFGSGIDLEDKSCCNQTMEKDGHTISFEVFMGVKGDKIPDIDLNFSGEYQHKVHKYVEEIFGKENVFRAGTISTLAKRNAFGYIKKYFEETNIKANVAQMELYASKCENVRKTTGQHPGGMIILPKDRSIYEFTPIQRPANDQSSDIVTTHFDYHVMDEQLVKLDILGHDDPTTLKTLESYTGIDPTKIKLDDKETISIFNSTKALNVSSDDLASEVGTYGIPEFGTPFSRRMLFETKPQNFADLIRISGLSHGIDVWSNNAQNLIKKDVAKLQEVISVRDDIMNYLISKGIKKDVAFTIMEFVRKGLPTKKIEDWSKYVKIMEEHKVPNWYIESCKKITYIFPKGHAAAYVLMAVRIAYFKVHHPVAFYAAYLTRKADFFDFEKYIKHSSLKEIKDIIKNFNNIKQLDPKERNELYVWEIILEMQLRGIEILPIDLYKSLATQFSIEDNKIRIPFIVLNGLGSSVAENIVVERVREKFDSFEDLKKRTKVSQTICDIAKELKIFDLKDSNQGTLF